MITSCDVAKGISLSRYTLLSKMGVTLCVAPIPFFEERLRMMGLFVVTSPLMTEANDPFARGLDRETG